MINRGRLTIEYYTPMWVSIITLYTCVKITFSVSASNRFSEKKEHSDQPGSMIILLINCSRLLVGVLQDFMKEKKMSSMSSNFVGVLTENNRLNKLKDVLSAWTQIMSAHKGEIVCNIKTAKVRQLPPSLSPSLEIVDGLTQCQDLLKL